MWSTVSKAFEQSTKRAAQCFLQCSACKVTALVIHNFEIGLYVFTSPFNSGRTKANFLCCGFFCVPVVLKMPEMFTS